MTRALAPLALVTCLATPAFPQATIGGEWRDDVAAYAGRLIEAGLTPGIGIAVTQGDWVLWADGFGVADASTGRPADAGTAFYIASSTKALTATAVLLLAHRGELDLAAPITRYVPGLRFAAPLAAEDVTIESLLTMTHGIDDGGPVVLRTAYTGDFTNDLLIGLLAEYGPAEGGRAFDYGNLGYNILGLALDPDREHGWKDVVLREVLDPLGMAGTSARLSDLDPGRIALPHELVPDAGWRRIALGKDDANLHAAGGHFTTPRDLARFVAAHASGGLLEGRRVFAEETIRSTHERHAEQDREFGPFRRFGWGYGWDLGTWEGKIVVHRFGSFAGYRSHMSFMPEHGIGVVVLVNGSGPASPAADLLATYAYDRLLGREGIEETYAQRLADLEARVTGFEQEMGAHLAERRARLAPLPHPLADYAGVYENPAVGRMEWRVVAGGLEARMGVAHGRAEVYDAAEDALRVELFGGGDVADFTFPAGGGPATALELDGRRYERVR